MFCSEIVKSADNGLARRGDVSRAVRISHAHKRTQEDGERLRGSMSTRVRVWWSFCGIFARLPTQYIKETSKIRTEGTPRGALSRRTSTLALTLLAAAPILCASAPRITLTSLAEKPSIPYHWLRAGKDSAYQSGAWLLLKDAYSIRKLSNVINIICINKYLNKMSFVLWSYLSYVCVFMDKFYLFFALKILSLLFACICYNETIVNRTFSKIHKRLFTHTRARLLFDWKIYFPDWPRYKLSDYYSFVFSSLLLFFCYGQHQARNVQRNINSFNEDIHFANRS